MTPADYERVLEILDKADGIESARAAFKLAFAPKPRSRPPKVSAERKAEITEQAIQWYARKGGKRYRIAFDASDEHGEPVARNDDEVKALERILRTDPECQRRLNEIDAKSCAVTP